MHEGRHEFAIVVRGAIHVDNEKHIEGAMASGAAWILHGGDEIRGVWLQREEIGQSEATH